MAATVLSLALLLAFGGVPADQKPKDKDKDKDKAKPAAAAQQGPAGAADLMAQGDAKAAAGDLDGAIELLTKAAAADATGTAALHLGRAQDAKLDLEAAMDAYTAAAAKLGGAEKGEALARLALAQEVRARPETDATAAAALAADAAGPWPAVAAARSAARAGKADEALALADAAQKGGVIGPAASARGLALESKGDLAGAEAAYRSALAADQVNASLGLARVLRRTGRAAEAEPLLATLLASVPGAIAAYKESARVKVALGRPEDALGDAASAAAMAEDDKDAATLVDEINIARALKASAAGQVDGAIRDLTTIRDARPDWAPARLGLGRALVAKRQIDAALVELKKAAELDPASAEAQYQLGLVTHRAQNNAAGALTFFEAAVKADGASLVYRESLGAALTDAKQYDRAIAELATVTASPEYKKADAWVFTGAAQLASKRYAEAAAAFEKSLTLAPPSAQVEGYLAWSYFGLKDAANFKAHGAKARELGYKDATFLSNLARVEKGEAIK